MLSGAVLTGTDDITARQLAGALFEASDDKGKAGGQPRIIQYVTDRAGLLIERVQGEIYTFPHRTFQEYLAACHLAGTEFPYELAERLRDDDERWREVALLAAAKAASGTPATIWTLLGVFCPHDWSDARAAADADWYAALRATQALVETEQERNAPERQRHLVARLHAVLGRRGMERAEPASRRCHVVRSGRVLQLVDGTPSRPRRDRPERSCQAPARGRVGVRGAGRRRPDLALGQRVGPQPSEHR